MDRSRYKRHPAQTAARHITKNTFGNPAPVPKALPARPQPVAPPPVSQTASAPQPTVAATPVVAPTPAGLHTSKVDHSNISRFKAANAAPTPHITSQRRISHRPAVHRGPQAAPAQPQLASVAPVAAAPVATAPLRAVPASTAPQPVALSTPQAATPQTPDAPAPRSLAQQVPMDMDLPGEASTSAFARFRSMKWYDVRRWGLRGSAIAVVLVITIGGLLFSQSFLKAHKVFKGGTGTAAALKSNVDPTLLKGEGSGRINILLLGRGGGTHDAPDLTDTMMVASIDPINHKTTLFSIPRDLWVNVDGAGVMKINAAWETGVYKYLGKNASSSDPKAIQAGFDIVDKTVQNVLGINIDYNTIVDFKAFQQAVDTVGGVSLDVPSDLVDPTMAWENENNPVLAKAGIQAFDGRHALIYARSRETTSDFARALRQRTLLLALKGKVDNLGTLSNPLKLSGLLNAFGNNVSSDLSLNNATRLYSILKKVPDTGVNSIGLADGANQYVTSGNISGQSVVLPKAGIFNYADIQNFVRSQLKDPYIVRENAKVLILNGTTYAGLATTKSNELKSYGYNVVGSANTPNTGWTQTTLIDLTHNHKYTKHYLEQHFNLTAANSLADSTIPTNGADFVIIIGSDEALPTQTPAH